MKNNDNATLQYISKTVSILKKFETNESHEYQVVGQANSPLTWIIHKNVAVATVTPTLDIEQHNSMEHGSVKLEMVHCLSHTNNIYAEDIMTVYSHIVEANLSIQHSKTIAPFKIYGNGRGA